MDPSITAEEALRQIGEQDKLSAVSPHWEESQRTFVMENVEFLRPEAVRENREWCGFEEQTEPKLLAAAAVIRTHPALSRLAWHCAWRLFDCAEESHFEGWPDFHEAFGEDGGLFYLLIGISMAPRIRAHHKRLGIPEDVTRDTCLEAYAFNLNHTHMAAGRMGIPRSQLFWLRHYTREQYFRLGRFEFWLKRFDGLIKVYRNRQSGDVLALVSAGERFDEEGFMPISEEPVQPGDWVSTWEELPGSVTGNPILPDGRGVRVPVSLDLNQWELLVDRGSWVLDMHIPAGGKMTPEACKVSLLRAKNFFAVHFPDTPPGAVVCWSWIYSPVLDQVLPEESNLVRNMKESYLFPYPSDPADGLGFVFYQDTIDLETAPSDTSVQRAFLNYLRKGKRWRCGGMFLLIDDLEEYGSRKYRKQQLSIHDKENRR